MLFAIFAFRSAGENFSVFFPSVKSFFEFAFFEFFVCLPLWMLPSHLIDLFYLRCRATHPILSKQKHTRRCFLFFLSAVFFASLMCCLISGDEKYTLSFFPVNTNLEEFENWSLPRKVFRPKSLTPDSPQRLHRTRVSMQMFRIWTDFLVKVSSRG